MRHRVGILVAVAVSAPAALCGPIAAAVQPATSGPRVVPVKSSYDTALRTISRDIGISAVLPNKDEIWLFGDTGVYTRTGKTKPWKLTDFVDGSTAMEASFTRGEVPHGGEIPARPGKPTRFLPEPNDVYLPDGSGTSCTYKTAAFPGRWPTGAVMVPANPKELLVTYSDVCVTHVQSSGGTTAAIRPEGWGYAFYNWQTHHMDRGPIDVFKPKKSGAPLPASQIFGSPVYVGKKLAMFSSSCTSQYISCTAGKVWSASVAPTVKALSSPSSYKTTPVATDGSGQFMPLTISVGKYPSGYRIVEMTSIGGDYSVFSAASIGAKWHLAESGRLPGCPSHLAFCFALEGHPELSTPSSLFVSYKDPDSGPGGQIVVSALPD